VERQRRTRPSQPRWKVYKIRFPPILPSFWPLRLKGGTAERCSASCETEPPKLVRLAAGSLRRRTQLRNLPEARGGASEGSAAPWGASGASRRSTGLLGASTRLPGAGADCGSALEPFGEGSRRSLEGEASRLDRRPERQRPVKAVPASQKVYSSISRHLTSPSVPPQQGRRRVTDDGPQAAADRE